MFSILEQQSKDTNPPRFSDEVIRKINCKDIGEDVIDLFEHQTDRLRMLPTPDVPYASDTMNAGFPCSSYIRKSLLERLIHMTKMFDLLTENKRRIAILLFEGLRDSETQKHLFEKTMAEIKAENTMSDEELYKAVSSIVSPPNEYTLHSTGGGVDIRLFDMDKNEFLDLGKFGHFFGKNEEAFTFAQNITEEQKNNRNLLLNAAIMSGLVNYPYEWWHFSFGDKYFCFYTNQNRAIYENL